MTARKKVKKILCVRCEKKLKISPITYYKLPFRHTDFVMPKGCVAITTPNIGCTPNGLTVTVRAEQIDKLVPNAHVCYDCQIEVLEYALKTAKEKRERDINQTKL